jgi:hypothetical protein
MTTRECFKDHVTLLLIRARQGDEDALRSLACIVLAGQPDGGGGGTPLEWPVSGVVDLSAYRKAA